MEKITVKIMLTARSRYGAEVEIPKWEFDRLNALEDRELGEALSELVNLADPMDVDDFEVDEFEPADTPNEPPRCAICGKPMTFAEAKVHDPEIGDCCAEHFDNV